MSEWLEFRTPRYILFEYNPERDTIRVMRNGKNFEIKLTDYRRGREGSEIGADFPPKSDIDSAKLLH